MGSHWGCKQDGGRLDFSKVTLGAVQRTKGQETNAASRRSANDTGERLWWLRQEDTQNQQDLTTSWVQELEQSKMVLMVLTGRTG